MPSPSCSFYLPRLFCFLSFHSAHVRRSA
jgi:hypothetical protein